MKLRVNSDHDFATLVDPAGSGPDDTDLWSGTGLSNRHHLGFRPERVTSKDGFWQFDVLPTEIGRGVLARVRDR